MKKMEIFFICQLAILFIVVIVAVIVCNRKDVTLSEFELGQRIPYQEMKFEYEYAKAVSEDAKVEQETLVSIPTPVMIVEAPKYFYGAIPLDEKQQYNFFHICEDLHLSPSVALAFMESESGFDEDAIGSCGEIGLMQVHPINFERMMVDYGLKVEESKIDSLNAGLIILKELIDKYQELDRVTMCYKCGEERGNELLDGGTRLDVCDTILERSMYWEEEMRKKDEVFK